MERSPLGQLGKLPYEIRLEIYEKLFAKKTPLTILRCSRAIHGEITKRLYDTLNIHLTPVFNDPWIEVRCKRLRLRWTIPNHSWIAQARFSWIPYHKVNLVIHIYAPDPRNPGQIALLWQKVQYLVYILQNRAVASIVIRLREHQGRDWQEEGHVVESIPYPNKCRPDHHIVFLPFCRLISVGSFRVLPDTRRMDRVTDWGLINYGRDFILNNGYRNYNDGPLSQDRQYRDIVRDFDNIDGLIRDTDFFLETRLDTMRGNTAAMLRLDRVAHWPLAITVDSSSRLESSVNLHDPGLSSHSLRMCAFYNMDSWEEWLSWFPEGLDPHGQDSIDTQTQMIMDNPERNDIWDSERADREYETNIENYLERNWNGSPAWRYPSFEKDWCTDCRRIGYRTGCDQDCELMDGPYYGKYWDIDKVFAADFTDSDIYQWDGLDCSFEGSCRQASIDLDYGVQPNYSQDNSQIDAKLILRFNLLSTDMPASPQMSADEGSLTGAAQGMLPPSSDNGALGGHLPSSFNPWWGPEWLTWLLVEEPNDIAVDPVERWKRLLFLLEYGDYAARVWNFLLRASRALRFPIHKSVIRLIDEIRDASLDQGLDIDLEMAKLAILVYSKRNLTCHARIGEISNSAPLRREIERAKSRLREVLPSEQFRNYSAWQRILAFYGSTQDYPHFRDGAVSDTVLPEPDRRHQPDNAKRLAFEKRVFDDRLDATFQTINERIPVTFRPVPGQTRTKHSVSDPLPYAPRKRRAIGSPDSEERTDGKPAALPFPTVAFGNVEDACIYQEIYRDLEYVFGKDRTSGRRALEEARKVVRQARANVDRSKRRAGGLPG
ncbi:uncharacterized protein BO87DRAFT_400755 [Aspergillus neoniger CBS 115656]|uniref:Uncharacterized protein n=1 Tax=Aspergillus neoniger (strain CBS 115656) TaxID=1448310 RepID=A0A318YCI4_ASPNB|nr:hypothetical protein BO87DRAFT_400755 [Aspergillus neoniger CBS 115656]PYH30083.1 hypothetical protein BO87DRAFT_400755 [Aspergillus neoniger CBS 115656]